jgi:hypothetical protein
MGAFYTRPHCRYGAMTVVFIIMGLLLVEHHMIFN